MPRGQSFIWKIPLHDFKIAIYESTTWKNLCQRYCTTYDNISKFRKRAIKEGLNISHLKSPNSIKFNKSRVYPEKLPFSSKNSIGANLGS